MNTLRNCTAAILAVSLFTLPAASQSWQAITAASATGTGSGGFWDNVSNDGGRCNIGFVLYGTQSAGCTNGDAAHGQWIGGNPVLVDPTASFLNPGAPFMFAAGTWKIDILGGFRGSVGGWLGHASPSQYLGTTDGVHINTFSSPGSYMVTYAGNFALSMPGSTPPTEFFSNEPLTPISQFALFSSYNRTGQTFNGVLGLNVGDKYVIGFGDEKTNSDHDYQDVVIVATAITAVPEPASIALLATGLLGMGLVIRRRKA